MKFKKMSNLVQVNNDNKVFPYGVEWVYMSQGLLKSEYIGFSTPQEARKFIEQNKSYNFINNK
tara:strand:- start:954 stop:1142 length:189 start_codon:yes stop_codon:yes gene_type:complete